MPEWMRVVQIILKIIFWVLVPFTVIYYRYKKKISTGFAVGLTMSSLLLGLIFVGTVKEDPFKKFYDEVNAKNYEETRKAYKILIQYGTEHLEKIDESQIVDLAFFNKVKQDIKKEYKDIATSYCNEFTVTGDVECKELVTQEKYLNNLKHALKLLEYSESIGQKNDELKDRLRVKVEVGDKTVREIQERCN